VNDAENNSAPPVTSEKIPSLTTPEDLLADGIASPYDLLTLEEQIRGEKWFEAQQTVMHRMVVRDPRAAFLFGVYQLATDQMRATAGDVAAESRHAASLKRAAKEKKQ
jgi:hypothetical protein